MNAKKLQLRLIVLTLFVLGLGGILYKNLVLGFPLLPEKKQTVWTVESQITFEASGGPATISLNLPDDSAELAVTDVKSTAPGFRYAVEETDGVRYAVWRAEEASGTQKIFLRASVYRTGQPKARQMGQAQAVPLPVLEGALAEAATTITSSLDTAQGPQATALALLTTLNNPSQAESALLLQEAKVFGGKLGLARSLLTMAGIQARLVKGLHLEEDRRRQSLHGYIEVQDGKGWLLINPRTAAVEERNDFLVWQAENEATMELVGGSGSQLRFSTLSSQVLASRAAVAAGKQADNLLVDFSIYSLPIAEQNTFKLLLLIPIGALVVVILRNLVGIATSGTFMPILIAMVFLQTSLLTGLFLFLVVVGVGLVLRSYLSHLNLLLVPRISAVLVFVIFIYVAIAVMSHKLGFEAGMQVTFFPMIIISWTIERMSILWEEEGPKDVFVQGGGSLFAASLIYLAMENKFIGHLTYSFPELLLALLAIIIMIGSYSGYRLSELRRFEPLVREK